MSAGNRFGDRPTAPGIEVPLERVPELLQAAALVVDGTGAVTAVNTHLAEFLDRDAADLVGRDAHDALHRDRHGLELARAQCPLVEAHLDRRSRSGTAWFLRGNAAVVELEWTTVPCGDPAREEGTLVLLRPYEPRAAEPELAAERGLPLTELERLALLAETTTQLTSTLDTEEMFGRLIRLVVPRLADCAVIDLLTELDEVERSVVVQYQDGELVGRSDLEGPMPPVTTESQMPLSRALRGAASSLTGPETYQGPPDAGIAIEQRKLFTMTGMHSAAIAPIRGVRDTLGALTLGRVKQPRPMSAADLSLLEDITRRTGLALDNARLYHRQRKVAETMQRHLLPQLPEVPGLQMTARYLAAPDESQVGGDWYDAFPLADGVTALAIGDVAGHDLNAAAGMAQIRSILRAYAWLHHDEKPSAVVNQLNASVGHIAGVPMATLVYGSLRRLVDGQWQLEWTNAGHPPPLLVMRDGRAHFLTGGHGPLLVTGIPYDHTSARVVLPAGSTLVLYTDGLVERRDSPIDEGMGHLSRHAAALAHRPLAAFADLLLERALPDRGPNDDDTALLVIRIPDSA